MEGRQLRSAGPIRDDRVDILGVGVSPINLDDAIATIERWVGERSRNYVCITGVHGVMQSRRADIVWGGIRPPKEEFWMEHHAGHIEAPVMVGVGDAVDFLAGTKRQAPLWMQRRGLEWLFRLCSEPRRLWRRYAYIVPGFAILAVGDLVRRAISFEEARSESPLRE